jgi:hypothetical protein
MLIFFSHIVVLNLYTITFCLIEPSHFFYMQFVNALLVFNTIKYAINFSQILIFVTSTHLYKL